MSPLKIAIGFVPWFAFCLVSGFVGAHGVVLAALAGLVLAAVFVVRSKARGRV